MPPRNRVPARSGNSWRLAMDKDKKIKRRNFLAAAGACCGLILGGCADINVNLTDDDKKKHRDDDDDD